MTYSQLPKEYQELVKKNRNTSQINENLLSNFIFSITPEGDVFWWACQDAKRITDLPPIPTPNHSYTVVDLLTLMNEFEEKTSSKLRLTLFPDESGNVRCISSHSINVFDFNNIPELISYLKKGFINGDTE
jgi:hypothetical protein